MSRVGKMPVALPKGVEAQLAADQITVKGPNGTLTRSAVTRWSSDQDRRRQDRIFAPADESREAKAMSGTMRALVANMVERREQGLRAEAQSGRRRAIRAQAQGDKLNLSLGFSHPVVHDMPAGIKVETPTQTEIVIKGADKQRRGPGGRRGPRLPAARALQGQGRALRRRDAWS